LKEEGGGPDVWFARDDEACQVGCDGGLVVAWGDGRDGGDVAIIAVATREEDLLGNLLSYSWSLLCVLTTTWWLLPAVTTLALALNAMKLLVVAACSSLP
jgi:hypothetical protein